MAINGTGRLIAGKVTHEKVRGRALVAALSKEYGNEESNAASMEGTKKSKYDKRKKSK